MGYNALGKSKALHAKGHKPAAVVYGSGTTYGPTRDLRGAKNLVFSAYSSAVSGTSPTLDISIQHSRDGINWLPAPVSAFTQITTNSAAQTLAPTADLFRFIRTKNVVGGSATPTVTASVFVAYDMARGSLPPGALD